MKIITDTSSLFTPEQGEAMGITVLPLSVALGNETYREFSEIDSKTFNDKVLSGITPTSSQPSIGETMEVFEKYQDEDLIVITIADGLSGTYKSTLSVQQEAPNKDNIHIINSQTLCGPQKYLVEKAIELQKNGLSTEEIVNELESRIKTASSFLMPQDFDFLKRGGRLTPVAAKVGGLLKIVPVMMQNSDGTRLEKFTVKKTFKGAIKEVVNHYINEGIDESYKFFVSHAFDLERANEIISIVKDSFPNNEIELLELSPAFITQGGPGCTALQAIKK